MQNNSLNLWLRRSLVVLGLGIAATAAMAADPYPSKPVRIVVPAAAGGGLDIVARLVATKMGEKLGQAVIVDNQAGGDTLVGTRNVKNAPADGYTVLAHANGFTILPELKEDPGYDPLKDFTGIGLMSRAPFVMEVASTDPSRDLKEFIARAKKEHLSFASGGIGGPPHMAAVMFLKNQGLDLTPVPYKGNGVALPDVATGRVTTIFDTYVSSLPFLQSGKLKPLAVTSTKRIAPLPNTPTFMELGIDYKYDLWLGLVVRSGTPKEVVQRLSDALRFALEDKDLKARLISEGSDPSFIKPEEFNATLAKEVTEMKQLVKELQIPKQ
ncbi:tripartite tricarboxylate transporter substrate binding protein [Variovorax rhizosphaerae]|uniref:Tripartite tricarboxylate transporter substrate binding protein n=1 Tax=Variovorax rhizosphaerae TaxID=1836200 RepID=A0ABU8WUH6_9BURK